MAELVQAIIEQHHFSENASSPLPSLFFWGETFYRERATPWQKQTVSLVHLRPARQSLRSLPGDLRVMALLRAHAPFFASSLLHFLGEYRTAFFASFVKQHALVPAVRAVHEFRLTIIAGHSTASKAHGSILLFNVSHCIVHGVNGKCHIATSACARHKIRIGVRKVRTAVAAQNI